MYLSKVTNSYIYIQKIVLCTLYCRYLPTLHNIILLDHVAFHVRNGFIAKLNVWLDIIVPMLQEL